MHYAINTEGAMHKEGFYNTVILLGDMRRMPPVLCRIFETHFMLFHLMWV